MKKYYLYFKNHCYGVDDEGARGTEIIPEIDISKKEYFMEFIPVEYKDECSFSWDFENNIFSVYEPYDAVDNFVTLECFRPVLEEPMPNLSKNYEKFKQILEKQFNLRRVSIAAEIIKESPEAAKLLGLL